MNLALIGLPGYMEVLLVILVILLLFGAKRLPELARSLGRSLTEFKKGREDVPEPDKLDQHTDNNQGKDSGSST